MEVICLKNNGKVKLVEDQHSLHELDKDKYYAFLYEMGEFNNAFKSIDPHSGLIKPIEHIHVRYQIAFIQDLNLIDLSERHMYGGVDRPPIDMTFKSSIDFIKFIASLEKITAFNMERAGQFDVSYVIIQQFYMEYEPCRGKTRRFSMNEYCAKHEILQKYTSDNYKFIPTLIKALIHFFGDTDLKYTLETPYTDRHMIFIKPDMSEWSNERHSDWLVSVKLRQSGAIALISYSLYKFFRGLEKPKKFNMEDHFNDRLAKFLTRAKLCSEGAIGLVTLATYNIMVCESTLPYEERFTFDDVDTNYDDFAIYDTHSWPIYDAGDIVESIVMSPYYVASMKRILDLSPLIHEAMGGDAPENVILQIKLFPTDKTHGLREVDPLPFKFVVYDTDLENLGRDSIFKDFLATLAIWLENTSDYNLMDIDDYTCPF